MERRNTATSHSNFSGHQGSYSGPGKGSWLKRIFLFLLLLAVIVAALAVMSVSGSRRGRPKPFRTVRSVGLIKVFPGSDAVA